MTKLLATVMLAVALTGCGPTDEQLKTLQDASAQLGTEITVYKQELAGVSDPVERAALQARVAEMQRQHAIFDKAISAAEDADDIPWAIGETIVGVVAGFFPAAGLALPLIRTLRKQRASIFKAVEAGGGVVNKTAAKAVLKQNHSAVAALSKWKGENGKDATPKNA